MSELRANVSAVAIDGRAVLIEGAPGSGKSSLALALIDRGAVLIGDDGVRLSHGEGRIWASPPLNIAGLIELRNVGLVELPTTDAPLALVLALDPAAPRLPEGADQRIVLGEAIPALALYPDSPALPLRAEYALKMYGLP